MKGSNALLAYIHFYAEGVTTPWTDRTVTPSIDDVLPPRAIYPIIADYPNLEISIMNDKYRRQLEGERLAVPYTITVQDMFTMTPVPGIMCYANLYEARGEVIPSGYRATLQNHPVKYIERPVAGTYNDNADDPTNTQPILVTHAVSDENGRITFSDMRMSQSGPASNYTVMFNCGNNVERAIHDIEVVTSIDETKVKFNQQLPDQVLVGDSNQQEYDFIAVIEVLDSQERGIPGKYPERVYVTADAQNDNSIEVEIPDESDVFSASKEDGVMTIPIKVRKLTKNTLANVTFVIDGIEMTTTMIDFALRSDVNESTISRFEFTEYPHVKFDSGIEINEIFTVKAQAFNLHNNAVDFKNNDYLLQAYFIVSGQAPKNLRFLEFE